MRIIETKLPGVKIVETEVFQDHRGSFTEIYNKANYEAAGITADFVQDNMSVSKEKGTLRGMHWQNPPYAQAKLLSCRRGSVMDVVVDLRQGSPTFGKWLAVELSQENQRQLYVPRGFAHGFLTLTDEVEFYYKCDNLYHKEAEGCMRYDAPEVGIPWEDFQDSFQPILSEKDQQAPDLTHADHHFVYEED